MRERSTMVRMELSFCSLRHSSIRSCTSSAVLRDAAFSAAVFFFGFAPALLDPFFAVGITRSQAGVARVMSCSGFDADRSKAQKSLLRFPVCRQHTDRIEYTYRYNVILLGRRRVDSGRRRGCR